MRGQTGDDETFVGSSFQASYDLDGFDTSESVDRQGLTDQGEVFSPINPVGRGEEHRRRVRAPMCGMAVVRLICRDERIRVRTSHGVPDGDQCEGNRADHNVGHMIHIRCAVGEGMGEGPSTQTFPFTTL